MTCRTRFAPSPTGFLHIGGARTALYCWLEARRQGGQFILRIEDTDRERSSQEAIDAILAAMDWLGMDYDEGPVFQTDRLARYREVAEQMVAAGTAYYAYETKEELEAMRDAAIAAKEKPRYSGAYRDRNEPYRDDPNRVIRFRNPVGGTVVFDDLIKGRIEWSNDELDDLVIFRSDGWPTYNFAVVVDDLDMGITEVIRGDDHVNNTPRQINIYHALGAPVPRFAHMPMILDPEGAKLSKRSGAANVMGYRDAGYLPHALVNYLARLGWSHGDQEIFSIDELKSLFAISDVNQKASRLDPAKLGWLNQHYLKTDDQMTSCLVGSVLFIRDRLVAVRAAFAALPGWTPAAIDGALRETAEALGVGLGKIAQPLRVAITGTQVSPSIDHTVYLAGRAQALARIDAALAKIAA